MAVRVATFTVTVKFDDSIYVQPGHLLGGMRDEILSWTVGATGYEIQVADAQIETEVEAARREALMLVGLNLDAAANNQDPTATTQLVVDAVEHWVELDGQKDLFAAYLELQREAMVQGFGQTK